MATEILRPNGVGDLTQILYQFPVGGSHYDKVDEVVADDAATYVWTDRINLGNTPPDERDYYHLEASSISTGSTINSVTVKAIGKCDDNNGRAYFYLKLGADVGTSALAGFGTSWALAWGGGAIDRPGGGSWSVSDLADLQAGIEIWCYTSGPNTYVTQVYVEVDYTPALVAKQSADTGLGAEALGSRIFGAAEAGSGTGASSLLAALIGTGESGLGSEFATKIFSVFDAGSGVDAVIARLLAVAEAGSGAEAALLIAALSSGDVGAGADLATLLKTFLAGDEGRGIEALKALIEISGPDMKLRARPGQVRIPSKGVNL